MATHRPDLNFIFPNAPNAPVSLNMGMRMPSWFDIKGLELSSPEDKEVRHHKMFFFELLIRVFKKWLKK